MGGASSKVARKLPKRAETPSWAGRATNPTAAADAQRLPKASEVRNEAIERDAMDPHLLANLTRLGPVRVDHHMQGYRLNDKASRMHQAVMQSEAEADPSNSTRNRILSATLADLLNERKMATRKEVERLANDSGIDVAKLESLARYLNTPGVGDGTRTVLKHGNGEETVTSTVTWEEPHYKS
ncbi:hypothetical protein FIBSPDRAFT_861298 [Athelia psychrophila]|uniref:Uncharacterized protein n=1 Tax=Athelia psychrophila TaxID=1759441 RepID=A0A166JH52_9AGAM|nr:hypothetical protein FIBSPDRAFT_861298 [Fibularhizoctonia sp. CBS 109695]